MKNTEGGKGKPGKQPARESKAVKKLETVVIDDLMTIKRDYMDNRAAAERKYASIAIQVTIPSVTQITDSEVKGQSYHLHYLGGDVSIGAILPTKYPENEQALKIKRGDTVVIKGLIGGVEYDGPFMVLSFKAAKIVSIKPRDRK